MLEWFIRTVSLRELSARIVGAPVGDPAYGGDCFLRELDAVSLQVKRSTPKGGTRPKPLPQPPHGSGAGWFESRERNAPVLPGCDPSNG